MPKKKRKWALDRKGGASPRMGVQHQPRLEMLVIALLHSSPSCLNLWPVDLETSHSPH